MLARVSFPPKLAAGSLESEINPLLTLAPVNFDDTLRVIALIRFIGDHWDKSYCRHS